MPTLTPRAQFVLDRVLALQQLSRERGVITTRTQNTLLSSLADADLAEVSLALANRQQQPSH
jgi:hypothetical protein